MEIAFTFFLLISSTFILIKTYEHEDCERKREKDNFTITAKGNMYCNGKPYTNGGIEFVSFWRIDHGWVKLNESKINDDGSFYIEYKYEDHCPNTLQNPYLYVHTNCNPSKSYWWKWWKFTREMIELGDDFSPEYFYIELSKFE